MCRLFAVVASRPSRLDDIVHDDLERFRSLAEAHADGWGIATRVRSTPPGPELTLHRATGGALGPDFDAHVGAAVAEQAIVHLRRASVGAVEVGNCHPFTWGEVTFAHNGDITVTEALDDAPRGFRPGGTTDSELYFSLVVGQYLEAGDWGVALDRAATFLATHAEHHAALNAFLGTPDGLYVYQEADEAEAATRVPGYFDLFTRTSRDDDLVVVEVASQGVADGTWQRLPRRTVLRLDPTSLDPRRARDLDEAARWVPAA